MPQPGLKPTTQTKYYPWNGGLDVVTPALSVDPGFAIAMVNYEPWFNGGYRRIDGYERFDGRAAPSDAEFTGFTVSSLTGISLGATLTGTVSGATGIVIGLDPTGGTIVGVTAVSGTFQKNEGITATSATITSTPMLSYAPSGTDPDTGYLYSSEWLAAAQNYYRNLIGKVPGQGDVLGAWQRNSDRFAFRENTGGTATLAYLASTGGWTTTGLTYASTMYYTSLTGSLPAAGATVTGGTSGATGTLKYAIAHDTTVGYLVLTNVSGTFQNGEALKVSGTQFATSSSVCTQFQFSAGAGTFRFINHNFYGSSNTYNVYGVNGVDPAFEIDESNVISPILMPQTALANQPASNEPYLITEYQNFLFLAFPGGVYQQSVAGVPMQFDGFLGAAEFSTGIDITGMFSMVGPTLVLPTAKNTQGLYGTDDSNFQQSLLAEKAGCLLNSGQLLDTVYALNNLGITSLSRTQSYGNFVGATVSQLIQPIVTALRPYFTDSTIVRESNQYRAYFSDGSCIIMYVPGLGQQNKAWAGIESGVTAQFGYATYPIEIKRAYNTEDADNNEVRFFLSTDGYVYQDGSGTSFDGAAVSSYVRLAFNNVGSPALRKHFRRLDLELNSPAQINLQFAADFSYSNGDTSSATQGLTASDIPTLNVFGGGGYWDSVNWDSFDWDGQTISTARADIPGTGTNVSFLVFHEAIVDEPFVLQGCTIYYDPRRLQR